MKIRKGIDPAVMVWPFERKCPMCGKVFISLDLDAWVYRDGSKLLCSWGCMRKAEQNREVSEDVKKVQKRFAKMTPDRKEREIRQRIMQGMSNSDIQKETGFSKQLINYYRKRIEETWKE